ncbi:tryptophan-rich sensory protein [Patescibacteria group bacterium]|nr:tryptophan-rich sensory protein [Patescibacteria group bacterium]
MENYMQYGMWIKPSWAPPDWIFGPVWSVLYLIIAISFGYVAYRYVRRTLPATVLLPFALNIIFNVAFTPLQFTLGNQWLASLDIILVLATLVWALYAIFRYAPWVTYVNIPYLLWVSFATVLQLSILYLNL